MVPVKYNNINSFLVWLSPPNAWPLLITSVFSIIIMYTCKILKGIVYYPKMFLSFIYFFKLKFTTAKSFSFGRFTVENLSESDCRRCTGLLTTLRVRFLQFSTFQVYCACYLSGHTVGIGGNAAITNPETRNYFLITCDSFIRLCNGWSRNLNEFLRLSPFLQIAN